MRTATRFRRIPRIIAVLGALAALLTAVATAGAQATRGEIDACVRDNLIKYAPPDRAVIDQYLSLAAACEAQLNGDPGASISVAPVGGDGAASGGGGADGAAAGDGGAGGSVAGSSGAGPAGTGSADDDDGTRGAARGAAPGGGDAVVLRGAAALPAADAGSPAAVSAVAQAPWWLLALLVLAVGGVAWAVVMGARRRTR